MDQRRQQVFSKIAANMGLFLTKYGNYITNASKHKDTPQQRQLIYYMYLSATLELFTPDIANFFTKKQRDTLSRKNDELLRLCLLMPGLNEDDKTDAREIHGKIEKMIDTPPTQKNKYEVVYNLDDAEMEKLRERSEQLYGDIIAVMDENTENIRKKRYGQTMYIAPKGLLMPNILKRALGRKTDSAPTNLKKLESAVNNEFLLIADTLFNKKNEIAAGELYSKLKIMLNNLAQKKNVYYSLADDVSRLGDILTAYQRNKITEANKLKIRKPFRFDGKLIVVPSSPMETKLLEKLVEMGAARQNNKIAQEARQVATKRDTPFINFILTGEGQFDDFKDRPQPYILSIISKHSQNRAKSLQSAAKAKQQASDLLQQASRTASTPTQQTKLLQLAAKANQQASNLLQQAADAAPTPTQQTALSQQAAKANQQASGLLQQAADAKKQAQQKAKADQKAQKITNMIIPKIITQDTSNDDKKKKTYNNSIENVLIGQGISPVAAKKFIQNRPYNIQQFKKELSKTIMKEQA